MTFFYIWIDRKFKDNPAVIERARHRRADTVGIGDQWSFYVLNSLVRRNTYFVP